jgi:hypothetical protein
MVFFPLLANDTCILHKKETQPFSFTERYVGLWLGFYFSLTFILLPPWSLSSSLAALAIYTAVTQTFIGKKFNLTIQEFHPRICQKIKIKSMYNQPNFGKKKKKKIAGRGRQMGQSQLPLWGHRYSYSMCICKQLGHHRPGKHVPITCSLFFFGTRHEKVIWTTKCCSRRTHRHPFSSLLLLLF